MYITKRPEITLIAEPSGVNRLFVDMEYIGKADRQDGQDSVKNHHTVIHIGVIGMTFIYGVQATADG